MRADIDDLKTARRAALRAAGLLALATAVVLPILFALWGPVFIVLTALWVFSLATACARYIHLSFASAGLAMELEALRNRPPSRR